MSVRRLLAAVLAVVGVVLAAALVRTGDRPPPAPGATSAVTSSLRSSVPSAFRSMEGRALRVLHRWDDRRAAAYRAGNERRLRSLYVSGSSAGEADVRLLLGYRARGFTVAGMETQVLALDVLGSRRGRLEVRVDDRVVGAVAVRGAERLRLPRDAATTRVVVLVRSGGGRWRVSAVRDAPGTGPG